MSDLRLPDQLEGAWESALILTYGADLAFYENALSRKLRDSCRNRVVLCDGAAFQALCEEQRDGHLRHLGLRYLAAGIYMPQGVAHAKLILLLSPEKGRLLVGSGNLGILGYTRNAELFATYEFSAEQPERLPEFLAVRELVEQLAERGYVHAPAAAQIRSMWDEAPWLYGQPSPSARVRHNLDASFLDQFEASVGGREVRELVALAPFLDERAQALGDLLARLRPRAVRLLLQRGRASADPGAVLGVLERFDGHSQVELFDVETDGGQRWVHAKLFLARLDGSDLCLQGSPNLSQMALTRAGGAANLELASLLEGSPGSFDGLLELLRCEPAGDPAGWEVHYERPDAQALPGDAACRLRGGEIDGQHLVLDCTQAEALSPPLLLSIGGRELPLEIAKREGSRVWLTFPEELMGLVLEAPTPVTISWQAEAGARARSNALVLCVQPALRAVRQYRPSGERLQHLGTLDLDDAEIEDLLHEFEQLLVIDRADVFRVAGRPEAAAASAADEEQSTYSLDDLDRDALLDHQRLRLYGRARRGADAAEDPLGALLAAITAQFKGLAPGREAHLVPLVAQPLEAQTEVEIIAELKGQGEQAVAAERRAWRLLKAFVRRFSRGLMTDEFSEFVGPVVVAMNYRILLHFVTVLLAKAADRPSWDEAWLTEQLSALLEWYWGSEAAEGVYRGLRDEERAAVDVELADSAICAGLLIALIAAATAARRHELRDVLERLADVGRRLLTDPPLPWPQDVIRDAMHASGIITASPPEDAADLEASLCRVLDWESQTSFLTRQAARYGLEPFRAYLEERPLKSGTQTRIFCGLAIEGVEAWQPAEAEQTLGDFMRYCIAPRYSLRLLSRDGTQLATVLWQAEPASSCILRDHRERTTLAMDVTTRSERPWDEPLHALFEAHPVEAVAAVRE